MTSLLSSGFRFFKTDRKLKSEDERNLGSSVESTRQTFQLRIFQCPVLLEYYDIKTEDCLLLHHSKIKLNWYFVFCPPLPCRTHQEGRFKWWKELGSQGIHKNKCFSLCSGWLTGGNTFKVAVTIYVHDAVEREVTLKMKGLWDRDKRYQGMAVTNGGSLGV